MFSAVTQGLFIKASAFIQQPAMIFTRNIVKMKTHKGTAKRFIKTAKGFKRGKAGRKHGNAGWSQGSLSHLTGRVFATTRGDQITRLKKLLPYH